MLDRFAWLVEGLVVRPEQMRRNLELSRGLFFSQRLLLGLVGSGLVADEAYRLVQGHAMRAWEEELDFPELVRADAEITKRLDATTLDSIFDLSHYTARRHRVRTPALADEKGGARPCLRSSTSRAARCT